MDHRRINELKARFDNEPCVKAAAMHLEMIHHGSAKVSMTIGEHMAIKEGFANGGFLATIGNTAGVYAAMSKIPHGHTKAANFSISFTSPAKIGERITALATVFHQTKRCIWVTFIITGSKTGEPKALGSAQYIKPIKPEPQNNTLS